MINQTAVAHREKQKLYVGFACDDKKSRDRNVWVCGFTCFDHFPTKQELAAITTPWTYAQFVAATGQLTLTEALHWIADRKLAGNFLPNPPAN